MLPEGADTVVPVEDTDAHRVSRRFRLGGRPARSLQRAGCETGGIDLRAGDRLLEAGIALTPQAIAVAAAGGNGRLTVHRRPRVAVLATGDELVPAGEPLGPAQNPGQQLGLRRVAGPRCRRGGDPPGDRAR